MYGLIFFLDVSELKSHLVVPDSFTSHLFPLDVEDSPDGAMVEPTDRTCLERHTSYMIVRYICRRDAFAARPPTPLREDAAPSVSIIPNTYRDSHTF